MGSSIHLPSLAIPASHEDTDFQRSAIADLLHRPTTSFPGAQPVSFSRAHLRELQEVDYFMCEKTDGIRCLLYLTQHVDPGGELVEAQYLVDRKNGFWYVERDKVHIPRVGEADGWMAFHTGTLLDGELVKQREKHAPHNERITYLIFDGLAVDGESITNRDFSKRLARIESFVMAPMKAFKKKYPEDVANQPFQIEMKKMEFPYGFVMMFDHVLPALPHGNDGLIFTCKDTHYESGTDPHILKWKPPEENTVDFRLILGEFPKIEEDGELYEDYDGIPEMELYVNYGGDRGPGGSGYQAWATMHVTEAEWTAMKGMNQQLDGRIIECFRDATLCEQHGREVWRPKIEAHDGTPRFRDDKKDANHISVVNSVLESIKDAVSEQDLKDAAYNIRKAFKERQAERQRREAEERKRAAEQDRRRREADAKRREEIKRREAERGEKEKGSTADGEHGKAGEEREPSPDPMDDDGPTYDDD